MCMNLLCTRGRQAVKYRRVLSVHPVAQRLYAPSILGLLVSGELLMLRPGAQALLAA
jgi:hypothetical protein